MMDKITEERLCIDCGKVLTLTARQGIPFEDYEKDAKVIRCKPCGNEFFDDLISSLPRKSEIHMAERNAYIEDRHRAIHGDGWEEWDRKMRSYYGPW